MSRIIRKKLYQKLKELPELRSFQRDFELLSGMHLAYVDETGVGDEFVPAATGFCPQIWKSAAGKAMCSRFRHELLASSAVHPGCATCDAGLVELAVPIDVHGIHVGFFLFGGVLGQIPTLAARHKARHLLRIAGLEIDGAMLDHFFEVSPVKPFDSFEAYLRVVHIAARQFAQIAIDSAATGENQIPSVVLKACGYLRMHCLLGEVTLAQVAEHCELSEGHFSRIFRRGSGLTFQEYVAQVRAEHARTLLLHSQKKIPEIAHESGFRSISQFHRVFHKTFGMPPSAMRRRIHPPDRSDHADR